MTIGAAAITLLAVLLAALAARAVSSPPSTAGMTLAYQSSLTHNDTGQMQWDENVACQFSDTGYVVTAISPTLTAQCTLAGSSYQNFILQVRVVEADGVAIISFLGDDRLEIFGDGHFSFYRTQDIQTPAQAAQAQIGLGSAALHPTSLGVSERANDITIQVQDTTYSFYANGQLLTTYTASTSESAGPIWLGTGGGQQAEFSDIAIYTAG
jgi:hypothetical protein